LSGALAGFLVHNWPPAKIFMGDAGSTFIGLLLASLTLLGTFYDERVGTSHVILAPLCILAIPLYDFTSVLLIRLSEGRSPFEADKKHFSHRLVELGLSKQHAVLTVHLVTLTTGIGGLLLYKVPDWTGALLVIALVLCMLTIVAILETVGRITVQRNEAVKSAPSGRLPP
jgi:UDP-GlcNAc:undecaprenyl-phosphate GlcNAc-1-phosphate transferase